MGMENVPDKINKEKKDENNKKNKNIEKPEKGNVSTEIGEKIDINELHEKLGHLEEEVTKLTGNYMKLKSREKWKIAKIAQLGKGGRKMCQRDQRKGQQNRDIVCTSI